MIDLPKNLISDERILWAQKPNAKAFVLPGLALIPVALFFMAIFLVIIWSSGGLSFELAVFFEIGAFSLIFLIPIVWQSLRCRNTEYALTSKRVIIKTGIFGDNIRYVDLDKIQEAYVEIGFFDKFFKTGSILILTAGQVAMARIGGDAVSWEFGPLPKITPGISAVKAPYEVIKLLHEARENKK